MYPESTDSSNPTILTPGQSVTLTVECVSYDATLDVDLGNDMYWKARVEISKLDGTLIQTVELPNKDFEVAKNVNGHTCNTVIFSGTWTVPSTQGETYKFKWMVDIYQDSSTFVDTAETTTYGKTPYEEPDGYFRINGKDATETSYHIVFNSQLSLEFVPTKNPDKITAVKVEVWKDNVLKNTVTLSQSGSTYTATYNLPSHGTYLLKGKIEWTGGSAIPKMNILLSWGDEDGDGDGYDLNQIIGGIMMFSGAAILLTEKKR